MRNRYCLLLIEDPALALSPGLVWRCSKGKRRWLHSAFTLSLCSSIVGAKDTHTHTHNLVWPLELG